MNYLLLTLIIPLLSGMILAVFGERARAPHLNIIASGLTFFASVGLIVEVVSNGPFFVLGQIFFVDSLNVFFVAITSLVGFTTSIFSGPYMANEREHGRLSIISLRLYKSMFQFFMFTMLSALTTNNMGLLWVMMEAATLTTVLLVSLYRTPASVEAAWKYFILCGVGIAQALFGTILLYFAAEKVLGHSDSSLLWSHLIEVKDRLDPTIMSLAFIFMLIGYGTKVGLVPLHNWLPDAHAEGPTPVSAVLSGLLLNVALYAILRCKIITDGALALTNPNFSGNLMMGFGLLTLVVAAFSLSRQRDIKRMFAYSSIEHMGIITFAFGMSSTIASFGGLLHMGMHSLTKSAIFFVVGHAVQKCATQQMEDIRGLMSASPLIGWGLFLGTMAILGIPPFGVFTSEFIILTHAIKYYPWAVPFLIIGLGVAFATIFRKVQPMVFGETRAKALIYKPANFPVYIHLFLVLLPGFYLPPYLVNWLTTAAHMLGK